MTELTRVRWRKSSYSNSTGGSCVEVAKSGVGLAVRDTKDRSGPMLTFGVEEWRRFLTGLR